MKGPFFPNYLSLMVTSDFHFTFKIWNPRFIAICLFCDVPQLAGLNKASFARDTRVAFQVAEVLLQKQALPVVMRERGWHLPLLQPGTDCCCCCCHSASEGATSATDSLHLACSCPSCGGRNSKFILLRVVRALLAQPTPSLPHPLFIPCPSHTQARSQPGLSCFAPGSQKAVKRLVLSRAAPQREGGFMQE